jgi:hypothetical protein
MDGGVGWGLKKGAWKGKRRRREKWARVNFY